LFALLRFALLYSLCPRHDFLLRWSSCADTDLRMQVSNMDDTELKRLKQSVAAEIKQRERYAGVFVCPCVGMEELVCVRICSAPSIPTES
jgi:hypothetical protein